MRYLFYVTFCLVLCLCVRTFSQNQEWITYTALDRTPGSSMAIDQDNNKWYVSDQDLICFDGTDCKIYEAPFSIPNDCIAIDKSNNIWMGDWWDESEGLVKYDGNEWTIYNTSNSGLPSNEVGSIEIDELNNIWLSTSKGLVKFDGVDWNVYNNPIFSSEWRSCPFVIDGMGNKWIIGVYGNELVKLDRNDTTWTTYNYPDSMRFDHFFHDIGVDKSNNVWLLSYDSELTFLLKFDGTNWKVYDDWDSKPFEHDIFYPFFMTIDDYDNIWIGTIYDNGLKKFDGTNWTDYDTSNSGILSNGLTFIEIDEYGNKWIGHRFEGLSVFNEGGVVSVEEESTTKKLLPENFTLYQNYPNPFNPSTTISYSIPKRSNVTLKVFDVLGSEVATLVKEEQPQGNYEVELNGSELTSGIYFYRLKADKFMETRKMILLK